ncbi:hypothetical protein C8J56DRAFT_897371 [Mycena floridula]|nr:hypothetical protein C8J56DRAFT_897371 [Mycena floridula]
MTLTSSSNSWSLTSLHLLISNGMGKTWKINRHVDPDPLSTPPHVRFLRLHYPHASPTSTHGDKGTRRYASTRNHLPLVGASSLFLPAKISTVFDYLFAIVHLNEAPGQIKCQSLSNREYFGGALLSSLGRACTQLDKAMQCYMAIRCRQIGDPIKNLPKPCVVEMDCQCAKKTEENHRKEEKKAANEQRTEEEKKNKQAEQERRRKLEAEAAERKRAERAAAKMTGASLPRTSSSAQNVRKIKSAS